MLKESKDKISWTYFRVKKVKVSREFNRLRLIKVTRTLLHDPLRGSLYPEIIRCISLPCFSFQHSSQGKACTQCLPLWNKISKEAELAHLISMRPSIKTHWKYDGAKKIPIAEFSIFAIFFTWVKITIHCIFILVRKKFAFISLFGSFNGICFICHTMYPFIVHNWCSWVCKSITTVKFTTFLSPPKESHKILYLLFSLRVNINIILSPMNFLF